MEKPSLADVQRLLSKLIVAPEGVAAGLDLLGERELATWAELVRGDERLSPVERLDIYANMYFFRLRDCLAEDYPAVAAVLGEDRFHNLVTDYLLAHRPAHYSLRYAGRHLPSFIATTALLERWPYLAELAALEWAVLEAFDAPDAGCLEAEALRSLAPEQWPQLRFQFTASLGLQSCEWPVQELWERVQAGQAAGDIEPSPTRLRIWRQGYRVFQRRIDTAETRALTSLRAGDSFGAACTVLAEEVGEATAGERMAELLMTWLGDGLFCAVYAS